MTRSIYTAQSRSCREVVWREGYTEVDLIVAIDVIWLCLNTSRGGLGQGSMAKALAADARYISDRVSRAQPLQLQNITKDDANITLHFKDIKPVQARAYPSRYTSHELHGAQQPQQARMPHALLWSPPHYDDVGPFFQVAELSIFVLPPWVVGGSRAAYRCFPVRRSAACSCKRHLTQATVIQCYAGGVLSTGYISQQPCLVDELRRR